VEKVVDKAADVKEKLEGKAEAVTDMLSSATHQ
jgi:hypothetical protein